MTQHRQTPRAVRAGTGLVLAAVLAGTTTACGSDHPAAPAPPASAAGSGTPSAGASTPPPSTQNPGQVLATIKGAQGIVITLTSATRDSGGFVAVEGNVKNTGSQPFTQAANWRGTEEALVKNGGSVAGATLVDLKGKKRYYVLRDTDGDCLCTTGLDIIQPGATEPIYAQFPAPPATTTQVEFELPTLPAASIAISR